MGGIKTSRIFYRRGISNNNSFFGFAVQGNYPIVQPIGRFVQYNQPIQQVQPVIMPLPTGHVPDTPTSIIGQASINQVSVSWTVPLYDGGFPITSYSVTMYPNETTTTYTASTTNVVFEGLSDNIAYSFTVIATNIIGNSLPSVESLPVFPVPPAFSILYDGSGSYLDYTGVVLGSSSFTVQVWFYLTAITGRNVIIGATFGEIYGFSLTIIDSTNINIDRLGVNSTNYTIPLLTTGTWYYLVYVRDSTTSNASIYLNGVQSLSGVQTDNYTYGNTNNIGCWKPNIDLTPMNVFNGYMNNLCVSNIALFVPTANTIPVPTEAFTSGTATQLLLNTTSSSVQFIDTSVNGFIMTPMGTPPPQSVFIGPL
jgi:hypothetical protein